MLIDEIKSRMTRAMRERDDVVRNILGLAVGEIQTAEARANRAVTDDEATAVVRKLLKSNEETLALTAADDACAAAKSDAQAMGVAMKHLKASGAAVEASAVQHAVKALRP